MLDEIETEQRMALEFVARSERESFNSSVSPDSDYLESFVEYSGLNATQSSTPE